MDEEDFTSRLKCDVELDFPGPNTATLNKWAADALRRVADRIEKDELNDGFHPVTDNVGKQIGTVYVDYTFEDNPLED